jgi:hypothetical protein
MRDFRPQPAFIRQHAHQTARFVNQLRQLLSRYRLAAVMCAVLTGAVVGIFAEASARGPSVRSRVMSGIQVCEPEATPTPLPMPCTVCLDTSQCFCIEYNYEGRCVQEWCQGGCECWDSYPPMCAMC